MDRVHDRGRRGEVSALRENRFDFTCQQVRLARNYLTMAAIVVPWALVVPVQAESSGAGQIAEFTFRSAAIYPF